MKQSLAVTLIVLLFCSLSLTACGGNSTKPMPEWISDPGDGAVGSAKTHVKGRYFQEELAITRARERLAARYGVEIGSIQTIKERVSNDKMYVSSEKEIIQQVKNATVKAKVRKTYYDRAHDEIWVWMYPLK